MTCPRARSWPCGRLARPTLLENRHEMTAVSPGNLGHAEIVEMPQALSSIDLRIHLFGRHTEMGQVLVESILWTRQLVTVCRFDHRGQLVLTEPVFGSANSRWVKPFMCGPWLADLRRRGTSSLAISLS